MRMRKPLMGLVVLAGFTALTAVAPAQAQGYPHRPEVPQNFTCTAQDWAGHALAPVTLQVPGDTYDAARRAQVLWRGKAKYATIACTAS
ncbi:hypothetical protein ABIA39_000429 [Nocardia sp. GAS34]|uniref:hypothetical protein n=1 Tax=unclassified Nocardia TaxID=2637762 RepID=UPI003D22A8B9